MATARALPNAAGLPDEGDDAVDTAKAQAGRATYP
jgi:hypothetical protein